MTHIKEAKPEKLTAEQALYRKAMSGPLEPEENLRLSVILADDTGQFEAAYDDVVAVLAALDAARAETEAVRTIVRRCINEGTDGTVAEGASDEFLSHAPEECAAIKGQRDALRTLAAELVEGLRSYTQRHPAFRAAPIGAPNSPARAEQADDITRESEAMRLIARARALGIGGEKGKGRE